MIIMMFILSILCYNINNKLFQNILKEGGIMEKSKRDSLITLIAIGAASAALGYYFSKKENREKVKENLHNTGVRFKNKIDELDYKYAILPCDESYAWNKSEGTVTSIIRKKAKSIEDEF